MNQEPFRTVTEVVKDIKKIVESQFSFVVIKGEVTNLKLSYSGHTYFTLKDKDSQIRCAIFRQQQTALGRQLESDKEFIIWGKISLYEARSEITVIVSFFMPYGEGQDALRLKILKEKLHKMGVFDETHKKLLPDFIEHIGVVTSESGAAIHDIIHVGRNRFPPLKITLYPALVQGDKAEASIIKGIEELAKLDDISVLIVGRGGGSKEDLAIFNSEAIAMTVINCSKPVVAAVGHETDRTILDMAASFTVSTPSAAAELVTQEKEELIKTIENSINLAGEKILSQIKNQYMRLDRFMLSLPSPALWLKEKTHELSQIILVAEKAITQAIRDKKDIFQEINTNLETLSPLRPLENGFALITQNSRMIKRKASLKNSDNFKIKFIDGEIEIKR